MLDAGPDTSGGFIKLGRNTGIPLGIMSSHRAADSAARSRHAVEESASDGYISGGEEGGGFMPEPRLKGETAEMRRARKNDVKEAQVGSCAALQSAVRRVEAQFCMIGPWVVLISQIETL